LYLIDILQQCQLEVVRGVGAGLFQLLVRFRDGWRTRPYRIVEIRFYYFTYNNNLYLINRVGAACAKRLGEKNAKEEKRRISYLHKF
jgi:hypothetical protein